MCGCVFKWPLSVIIKKYVLPSGACLVFRRAAVEDELVV